LRFAELRARPLSAWLLRGALAIPCVYHGAWNLSLDGAAWWSSSSGLPVALRFVVGVAEVAAALALLSGVLSRVAAAGLVVIFVGAVPHHIANGFSFKHGGYEPLVVDALLALAVVFHPQPS
jgi:putative oxidoreductase